MVDLDQNSTAGGSMPTENKAVYNGFLGITKWAVILIALVLILMAIFLV